MANIKYIAINGWTITSGGKKYKPSEPNRPVFIEGLSENAADRLLKEKKIAMFFLPDVDVLEQSEDTDEHEPEPENLDQEKDEQMEENPEQNEQTIDDPKFIELDADISKMNLSELQEQAKKLGIKLPDNATKADIRTLIRNAAR